MNDTTATPPHDDEGRPPILSKIVDALNATLAHRIVAIYTYGSAFGRPRPRRVLRLLILVDHIDRPLLDEVAPIAARARGSRIKIRVESHETLLRGADAFPVFALEFADTGKLIDGRDVLSTISVDPNQLRLRLEQSLRTLHRDLVADYLAHHEDPQHLATALRRSARPLPYLFQALLIARSVELSGDETLEAIIDILCHKISVDQDAPTWDRFRAFATYEVMLDHASLTSLYSDVLEALHTLIGVVDRLDED